MPFSEEVKDQAYIRSGGRCECQRQHSGLYAPHHGGRCDRTFTRHAGQWRAHRIVGGGLDTLSNCEALCLTCQQLAGTFGR